jgi:hypothetical protein
MCLYVEMRAVVVSSMSRLNQVQVRIERSNATKQSSRMGFSSSLCIAYSSRGWRRYSNGRAKGTVNRKDLRWGQI